MQRRCVMWGILASLAAAIWADDKPPRIKPEDARKYADKQVEVVFEVKASKHSMKRKTVYLDSETDFSDAKNLGIAVSEQGIADLKQKRSIDAPADYYLNKQIKVTGKVVIEDDRPYIKVDSADNLDLANDEKKNQSQALGFEKPGFHLADE